MITEYGRNKNGLSPCGNSRSATEMWLRDAKVGASDPIDVVLEQRDVTALDNNGRVLFLRLDQGDGGWRNALDGSAVELAGRGNNAGDDVVLTVERADGLDNRIWVRSNRVRRMYWCIHEQFPLKKVLVWTSRIS